MTLRRETRVADRRTCRASTLAAVVPLSEPAAFRMLKRMPRRVLVAGWIVVSFCCCLATVVPAQAQLSFAPSAAAAQPTQTAQPVQAAPQLQALPAGQQPQAGVPAEVHADVAEAIRVGRELESQRRWSEALTFYEEALRRTPQHQTLEERLHLTRIHYDLTGRYGDPTYVDSCLLYTSRCV